MDTSILYNVIKNDTENNNLAKKYTGEHKNSFVKGSSHDIYYYETTSSNAATIDEKINVVFANQCWQMFRTTDIGVKLLYNGETDSSGQCKDDRANHVGYNK